MKSIKSKQTFWLSGFLLLSVSLSPLMAKEPPKGDLIVGISGFSSDAGKAMLALVNSIEQYEARKGDAEPLQGISLPIEDGRVSHRFRAIPYGEYAIKVFHDENSNGELDINFIGIPKEDYGFSNNARALGIPNYDEVTFSINSAHSEISIAVE
ncbi:MAG: DUF2141 domain-containing protein [Gammaproteobacteria bacterium]